MALTKEQAKEELRGLIDKFNNHPKKDHLTEEETKEPIKTAIEFPRTTMAMPPTDMKTPPTGFLMKKKAKQKFEVK